MKIGDRVKIVYSRNFMCPEMEAYCGQYATIVDIFIDSSDYLYYLLDIDNRTYVWAEETLTKEEVMKVGDKVKIKSLDWFNTNKEEGYYGDTVVKCGKERFISSMTCYCGKEAIITRINAAGFIFLDIDRGYYRWTEEMFESNTITIPEGYTVDKIEDNKIYLKKKELPKTWEECVRSRNILCQYIDDNSEICEGIPYEKYDKNCVPEGLGEPMLALMQLLVCREVYRQGWKPNWTSRDIKYNITYKANDVYPDNSCNSSRILSFQSPEVRDEFLKNFRDLIEAAKELI